MTPGQFIIADRQKSSRLTKLSLFAPMPISLSVVPVTTGWSDQFTKDDKENPAQWDSNGNEMEHFEGSTQQMRHNKWTPQQKTNLGSLTNITKADISENDSSYFLLAGDLDITEYS